MAYYQDFTKKKMTRKDHLRQDSTWEEEGTRYKRANRDNNEKKNDRFASNGKKFENKKTIYIMFQN